MGVLGLIVIYIVLIPVLFIIGAFYKSGETEGTAPKSNPYYRAALIMLIILGIVLLVIAALCSST